MTSSFGRFFSVFDYFDIIHRDHAADIQHFIEKRSNQLMYSSLSTISTNTGKSPDKSTIDAV